MNDKFTIKNLFIYWVKMWPVAVVLVLIGGVVGLLVIANQKQIYMSSASILVVNSVEGVTPTDYAGIINSNFVLTDALVKSGIEDGDCTLSAANTGNIVKIVAECLSGEEASASLVKSTVSVFSDAAHEIYGNDAVSIVVLSGEIKAAPTVTGGAYASKAVVPVVAGLVISAVVAFVRFDYATSKSKKK
jgi:hypothetical protein